MVILRRRAILCSSAVLRLFVRSASALVAFRRYPWPIQLVDWLRRPYRFKDLRRALILLDLNFWRILAGIVMMSRGPARYYSPAVL